jgi:ornithine carbamoyltransferase
MAGAVRHFLDICDFSAAELRQILDRSRAMKIARKGWPKGHVEADAPLRGRVLAMIFQRPSTRTRVSFEVAMRQLGGEVLVISANDMQLGRGETVADTARVLSRQAACPPARARRACRHSGDQRAHRQVASLPGHGRHHDLRGA